MHPISDAAKDDDEFITSHAKAIVSIANDVVHSLSCLLQDQISILVAPSIIDCLESIQIDKQKRKNPGSRLGIIQYLLRQQGKALTLEKPGEGIGNEPDPLTFDKKENSEFIVKGDPLNRKIDPSCHVHEAMHLILRALKVGRNVLVFEGISKGIVGMNQRAIFDNATGELKVLDDGFQISFMLFHVRLVARAHDESRSTPRCHTPDLFQLLQVTTWCKVLNDIGVIIIRPGWRISGESVWGLGSSVVSIIAMGKRGWWLAGHR